MASAPIRAYSLQRMLASAADPSGTFTGGEYYFNSTVGYVKFHNGTAWTPLAPVETVRWSLAGALTVANGALRLPIDYACTIIRLRAMVNTAPTGAAINLRLNKNGSSATTPSITASSNGTSTTPGVSCSAGDYLTMDITQVGSTVAGSDLVVSIALQQV